ncbi:hypothetical protein GFL21_05055 [Rhizobium anhuiense]|nr:hypothetical protein [Rhizobium anhuiense]
MPNAGKADRVSYIAAWMLVCHLGQSSRKLRATTSSALERFNFSWKRRTTLTFCFYTIPDGKPLRTFPGIALG